MGVKKKKAKPSPKGGKLRAKVKQAIKAAVKKLVFGKKHGLAEAFEASEEAVGQMGAIPQVDVPITSTQIKAGPPKKLTIPMGAKSKAFVDKLLAASEEIFENTKRKVHIVGTPLDSSPAFALKKWQEYVQAHQEGGEKSEVADLFDAASSEEVQKATKELVEKGKLLGVEGEEFKFDPAEMYPYQPLYTTPPLVTPEEVELTAWIDNAVKCALHVYQFEQFDEMSLLKIRGMIDKHYNDTVYSGGVGPPALFKELGKQVVMYRAGQHLRQALEAHHEKLDQAQIEMFSKVFPPESLPVTFNGSDKIITRQDIADWLAHVAQIVFDFIHWQHPSAKLLLDVRTFIEEVYDEDLLPKLPVAYIAEKGIPKAGVVHLLGVRVRHMLTERYGDISDEADDLFTKIFPLPDGSACAALAKFGDLMAPIAGPKAPTFIKSAEELKAVFGEPDMTNEQAKHVAIMLQKTKEYMAAHPKGIWDDMVKKLQPKFSEEAAKDAKENGFGDEVAAIICESQDPGVIPQMKVNVVLENEKAFIVTTCNGKVVSKKPAVPGNTTEEITPKGLATLNRFGVVLKDTG